MDGPVSVVEGDDEGPGRKGRAALQPIHYVRQGKRPVSVLVESAEPTAEQIGREGDRGRLIVERVEQQDRQPHVSVQVVEPRRSSRTTAGATTRDSRWG